MELYHERVARQYEQYFERPLYTSLPFWFVTLFFVLAFGRELWIMKRYWALIPLDIRGIALVVAVLIPLLWVMVIRQHWTLHRSLGTEPRPEERRSLGREVAFSTLFIVIVAYVLLDLSLEMTFHLLRQGQTSLLGAVVRGSG